MKDLTIFNYQSTPVRTVLIDGEPWFVLADLTRVLGLRQFRTDRLADGVIRNHPIQDRLGRTQKVTIVSEAGMYEVVIRSDKPEAAAFRRWITSEVLPEIRKTGSYGAAPALTEDEIVHRALQITVAKVQELEIVNRALAPKARAWDDIVSSEGSWSYRDVAHTLHQHKRIVIGEKRLVQALVTWGYLFRDHKGRPHAYQTYLEQGLFVEKIRIYQDQVTGERRESSAPQVRITGKGIDMIYRRLSGELEVAS